MTTQGSNEPDSQGESQEPISKGGVVIDDKSKGFPGAKSGPSIGGPQEGGREPEADEPGGEAR